MYAASGMSYVSYRNSVNYLKKNGMISIAKKNGKKFLKLTRKGELKILMAKARVPAVQKWDEKWRVITFDIPENAKPRRNQFRCLLQANHFVKFQASVYISPYPLNKEALAYLRQTGLSRFIRIMKAEEIDDDRDLKKRFNLR